MNPPPDIDAILEGLIADYQLSRNERQSLGDVLAALDREHRKPVELRRRAFAVAQAALARGNTLAVAAEVFDWLEAVVKVIDHLDEGPKSAHPDVAEAHFSPGDDCRNRIARLLDSAQHTVDICVFTITDDRISGPIVAAHRRGVAVRILTDNEKAEDLGSDVPEFRREGIPLRIDHTPAHMHHKFAVFDGSLVLTGSYNWTRGAADENEENLIVTSDPRLVGSFAKAFERLWERLGP
jgi:cardiolipin hydrolase